MRNWMAEKPCLGGIERKGSGNEAFSRLESAGGIYFRRGKLGVSRFTAGTHQFILLFYQVEILISTYSNVFLCSSADRGER